MLDRAHQGAWGGGDTHWALIRGHCSCTPRLLPAQTPVLRSFSPQTTAQAAPWSTWTKRDALGQGAPLGAPPVAAGLLPTGKHLLQLWGSQHLVPGSADVCVLAGIPHTNKCQGKPEWGRCHPPPAPNNITASKSGSLALMLLLAPGGARPCVPLPRCRRHRQVRGPGPGNAPRLRKSWGRPSLQPFLPITRMVPEHVQGAG